MKPIKVLAIQFKYLGDAVILTPALKALAVQMPNVELHVLVAAEIAPLLENLPWITKVWAMPRQRGEVKLWQALSFIKTLRRERFDKSVDFGGNDRGALLSYLSGAKNRLGPIECESQKWIHRVCYTKIIKRKDPLAPYFDLHFELLNAWNIERPDQLKLEIELDNYDIDHVSKILPINSILCHISTSQPKKDWPLVHWQTLYHLAHQEGIRLVFSAGPNEREKKLLNELKSLLPEADILPSMGSLNLFLNVLKSTKIFISGDTGPLHFADGLGVPILGVFGVGNSIRQVAPLYVENKIICADNCACDSLSNNLSICQSDVSCMASIQPESVFLRLKTMLHISDAI